MDESVPERLRRILADVTHLIPAQDTAPPAWESRFERLEDTDLEQLVRDRSQPGVARKSALGVLAARHSRDTTQAELLAELFHDPDEQLALDALRAYPPFDKKMAERIHALLSDERCAIWSEAASLLARRKDTRILRRVIDWLRGGDQSHFRVALECLDSLLELEDRLEFLEDLREREIRQDEASCAALAAKLLLLDDELATQRDAWKPDE